ncbi:MAG: multidrug efflux SMR transporter [Selenomonadaceae bacterium]|nr:multidrug efflux SMR transporter [Selenomonadaceae bacterium]
MHWLILFAAGLFEVVWAVSLKFTEGFTKLLPSVVTVVGTILSFVLLSIAMKKLPLSVSYAIWTGIGTIGTVLVGIFYFQESFSIFHGICLVMILCGIIGLRLLS